MLGRGRKIGINSEDKFPRALSLKEWLANIKQKDTTGKYYNLHKLISNPDFLVIAYNNLRKKKGVDTLGVDGKSLDGINYSRFVQLGKEISTGEYQPNPVKRIYIDKSNGKKRPLGLSASIDKIPQEAVRIILEYIYEPKFLPTSHGFRPKKSCHTALNYYKMRFQGISWILNLDIAGCFDNIQHQELINALIREIDDKPFFDLMWKFLKSGYIFEKKFNKTENGVPQGSIISPILSNIYLHNLDLFMAKLKEDFDKGKRRKSNPKYTKIIRKGKFSAKLTRKLRITPLSYRDENFKRLIYVRYADDFIIGIDGSKKSANLILKTIQEYLTKFLKFEIKGIPKIIHYRTTKTRFLGVDLKGNRVDLVPTIKYKGRKARSSLRPLIIMPTEKIKQDFLELNFVTKKGKVWRPTRCGRLIHHDLHRILEYYNSIYRGICGYYYICMNRALLNNLHYFLKYSCVLTIASKMKLKTKRKVFKEYGNNLTIEQGSKELEFISADYWKTLKNSVYNNQIGEPELRRYTSFTPKTDLFDACVSCGSKTQLEMHHINKQSNIKSTEYLGRIKSSNLRRQVVLCSKCHHKVHNGKYVGKKL